MAKKDYSRVSQNQGVESPKHYPENQKHLILLPLGQTLWPRKATTSSSIGQHSRPIEPNTMAMAKRMSTKCFPKHQQQLGDILHVGHMEVDHLLERTSWLWGGRSWALYGTRLLGSLAWMVVLDLRMLGSREWTCRWLDSEDAHILRGLLDI